MNRASPPEASLYALEAHAGGHTVVHRLPAGLKLGATVVYLLLVMAVPPTGLGTLGWYACYPTVVLALSETPARLFWRRLCPALGFALAMGIPGLLLDRRVLWRLGDLPVTAGALTAATLLVRAALCVAAVLLLVATTPMHRLTRILRRLRLPALLVGAMELSWRYAGVLAADARRLTLAHRLRGGGRGVRPRHVGSLLGMLLIRSTERAGRVWLAMNLRGGE